MARTLREWVELQRDLCDDEGEFEELKKALALPDQLQAVREPSEMERQARIELLEELLRRTLVVGVFTGPEKLRAKIEAALTTTQVDAGGKE